LGKRNRITEENEANEVQVSEFELVPRRSFASARWFQIPSFFPSFASVEIQFLRLRTSAPLR
jgi:hypothetical protein